MKRSDLHAGDEVFYRRGKHGDGRKAVVVDTERYEQINSWSLRPGQPHYRKADNGTLVLVDIQGWDGGNHVSREAVTLASLHGPYEQVKAEVEAAAKIARERYEAEEAAYDQELRELNTLVGRARTLGLHSVRGGFNGIATVSPSELALLLDAYESTR